jgi:hypothetical protein
MDLALRQACWRRTVLESTAVRKEEELVKPPLLEAIRTFGPVLPGMAAW